MADQDNLLANNRFLVSIGPILLSFAKVTNLSHEVETEAVSEGGSNWAPEILVKPKTGTDKLILERGLQKGVGASLVKKTLALGNEVSVVTIMVKGADKNIAKIYAFDKGMVTKWEIGELDAMGGGILIHRLEITHSGLYEVK